MAAIHGSRVTGADLGFICTTKLGPSGDHVSGSACSRTAAGFHFQHALHPGANFRDPLHQCAILLDCTLCRVVEIFNLAPTIVVSIWHPPAQLIEEAGPKGQLVIGGWRLGKFSAA